MKGRAYEIAINSKYDEHQGRLASMAFKFFDKKSGLEANINKVLAQELHKAVIKRFKER